MGRCGVGAAAFIASPAETLQFAPGAQIFVDLSTVSSQVFHLDTCHLQRTNMVFSPASAKRHQKLWRLVLFFLLNNKTEL